MKCVAGTFFGVFELSFLPSSTRSFFDLYIQIQQESAAFPVSPSHLDILLESRLASPRMSTKEHKNRIELLQGTLDLLILRTLVLGPAHGHAIAKAIEFRSDDVLQVEQGSLYPALHRLIKRRWISVEAGTSENNRRAKFYQLSAKGRRQLVLEARKWDKLAGAIARILRPTEEG
jgi:PadR family transcriptional regulator, regulatory protein PadR